MYEGFVYTDHTVLMSGRWKCYKIHTIPADYLLNIYQNKNGFHDRALIAYIEKNLDRIKAKKEGVPYILEEEKPKENQRTCTKKQYLTKKVARTALQKIKDSPGDHKKPVRSYECPLCNTWHLTSMSIEIWKLMKSKGASK